LFKAVLFVTIGAVLTFYLMLFFHLSAAISSGIIGLGVSFLPLLKRKWGYATQLPSLMYCGTFVGMASPIIHPNRVQIAISAFIYSIIYLNTEGVFLQYGGRLGASAFIGISFTYGFHLALKRVNLFQYLKSK